MQSFWNQWLSLLVQLIAILLVALGVPLPSVFADCDDPGVEYVFTAEYAGQSEHPVLPYTRVYVDIVLESGTIPADTFVFGGDVVLGGDVYCMVFAAPMTGPWAVEPVWYHEWDTDGYPHVVHEHPPYPDLLIERATALETIAEGDVLVTLEYWMNWDAPDSFTAMPQIAVFCPLVPRPQDLSDWDLCSCWEQGVIDPE
jgi:hypothetical protein